MLFFGHVGNTRMMRGLLSPLLALALAVAPARAGSAAAKPHAQQWMRTDETVVPIRENISRSGEIRGFLRKGQVVEVLKTSEHWAKVRANDTLEGWVPLESMEESGPPVQLDPSWVKFIFFAVIGLGLGAFLYLAISLQRKRRAESRERAKQAMADAKRRLQNKIQLLFREEPLIHSHLAMDQVPLRDFLQGIGYVANLEADPERFLASCKTFKPNLIVAAFEFQDSVEKMSETDAMLINTPVVYLQCGNAPVAPEKRVRAFLDTNTNEKELSDAIALCLKRSPEKIRYSVKPVALKGGIHAGTLMELLHFLSAVKKTGQLLAVSGSSKGEMQLHKGNIAKAEMKGLTGPAAAEAILNLAAGSFEFHERDSEGAAPEGTLNTQKILMDWAKAKDESNHHSRA
jgi:hypothetical protein